MFQHISINNLEIQEAVHTYNVFGHFALSSVTRNYYKQVKALVTFLKLQEDILMKCDFKVFFTIILSQHSLRLGGEYKDLQEYVNQLMILDVKPILDFYLQAPNMIKLQEDIKGQDNQLIRRFIALLFNVKPFTGCFRPMMIEVNAFSR